MSSQRRSKRRRKKKSGKGSSKGFGKSAAKGGKSSFFALIAGMTTTLTAVLCLYSFFFVDPPPAKAKPEFVVAKDGDSKFKRLLRDADEDQLIAELTALRQEGKSLQEVPKKAFNIDQRISVADKLLAGDLPSERRPFVVRQLIDAHRSRYGLYFLGGIPSETATDEFRQCFEKYLNDDDPEIYREAHLCEMAYILFEVIKGRVDSSRFTLKLDEVLKKFPNNDVVQINIRRQFEACIESDIDVAKQLGEELIRNMPDENHPDAALYQYLLNRYYLIESNYDQLFVNRYANGEPGLRELEKTSIELLNREDAGLGVAMEVNAVANWLEGNGKVNSAEHIYETMIDVAGNRDNRELAALLVSWGEKGLKRTGMIGKQISLAGIDQEGVAVGDDAFDNRVVMILFIDAEDKGDSLSFAGRFGQTAAEFYKNSAPVRSVVVLTETLNQKESQKTISKPVIVYGTKSTPALLEQYPVTKTPYMLLVDHNGIIVKANVEIDEFEREIQILIDRR